MSPSDSHPAPYRYEATIKVLIAADGLDTANRVLLDAQQRVAERPDVVRALAPMSELHHRPDLDGSLRVAQ